MIIQVFILFKWFKFQKISKVELNCDNTWCVMSVIMSVLPLLVFADLTESFFNTASHGPLSHVEINSYGNLSKSKSWPEAPVSYKIWDENRNVLQYLLHDNWLKIQETRKLKVLSLHSFFGAPCQQGLPFACSILAYSRKTAWIE